MAKNIRIAFPEPLRTADQIAAALRMHAMGDDEVRFELTFGGLVKALKIKTEQQ